MELSTFQFNEFRVQCETCLRSVVIDQVTLDDRGRLVCQAQSCVEKRTAILIKPQPKDGMCVDGWDV